MTREGQSLPLLTGRAVSLILMWGLLDIDLEPGSPNPARRLPQWPVS